MAEIFEIDLDSKYVIVSEEPLTGEDEDRILKAWGDFITMGGPALLVIDGTKYEFVVKEGD